MTHPANSNPALRWQSGLPPAFLALCDRLEIVQPEQGWVLALALRRNRTLLDGGCDAPLSPDQIEEILRRLTPAERCFQYGFDTSMPTGGALNPVNATTPITRPGPGQLSLGALPDPVRNRDDDSPQDARCDDE